MSLRVSHCVLIEATDWPRAVHFYERAFDFPVQGYQNGMELVAGPLRLFIEPGKKNALLIELATEDIDQARVKLRIAGFEEIVWNPERGHCSVVDPFGILWNVIEDKSQFIPLDPSEIKETFIRAKVGINLPRSNDAAQFYSELLDSPLSRLADGTWIIDSGVMRLRISTSHLTFCCLWLAQDAPTCDLADDGFDFDGDLARDPFGVYWRVDSMPEMTHAVTEVGT